MIHALSAKPSRDGFEHVLVGGITARFSEWDDTKVEAATIIARSAGFLRFSTYAENDMRDFKAESN